MTHSEEAPNPWLSYASTSTVKWTVSDERERNFEIPCRQITYFSTSMEF